MYEHVIVTLKVREVIKPVCDVINSNRAFHNQCKIDNFEVLFLLKTETTAKGKFESLYFKGEKNSRTL